MHFSLKLDFYLVFLFVDIFLKYTCLFAIQDILYDMLYTLYYNMIAYYFRHNEPGVLTPAHIKVCHYHCVCVCVYVCVCLIYLEGKRRERVKMDQSWEGRE